MTNLPAIDDELTRGSAWVTLWDAMLDGEARADALIALALRALPREPNELNVQRVLSYLTHQAYWTFTPPAARAGRWRRASSACCARALTLPRHRA